MIEITIPPEKNYYEISLDENLPHLEITRVSIYDGENVKFPIDPRFKLLSIDPNGDITKRFQLDFVELNVDNQLIVNTQISNSLNMEQIEMVRINIDREPEELKKATIVLELSTLDYIENKSMEHKFVDHLYTPRNNKILFSAPFGSGKTTFLDYFFRENDKEFEVFKVFPVNYSVASNEDIFRYIKTDILFQLMGKGVDFQKEEFSSSLTAQQFIVSNIGQIMMTLLKTGLSLSQETKLIVQGVEKINDLISDFRTFQEESQKDDKQEALKYIRELYEKEGSIFEDNFYTQLIRELLDQIKEKYKKQTVLVIDDLDRMDPDHIFRILNVISAHCDDYSLKGEKYFNKFGFDKIIVACDINNIRKIFEHRYGRSVDFKGYINKFYSSQVFEFSGKSISLNFYGQLFLNNEKYYINPSLNLLKILVESGFVSIRDIIKSFQNIDLNELFKKKENLREFGFKSTFIEGMFSLFLVKIVEVFGKENLIEHFESNKESNTIQEFHDRYSPYLIVSVANTSAANGKIIMRDERQINFKIDRDNNRIPIASEIKYTSPNFGQSYDYRFQKSDFYEFLILNIEMIDKHYILRS